MVINRAHHRIYHQCPSKNRCRVVQADQGTINIIIQHIQQTQHQDTEIYPLKCYRLLSMGKI